MIAAVRTEERRMHAPIQREYPAYHGPVRVAVEWMAPEKAAELLSRNDHNRHLKPTLIQGMRADIENDQFRLNGETIKIAADGRLIDGQNRLTAIVQAGKGVWVVVVRGLAIEDQDSVDIGVARTTADVLTIHGEHYANQLAAAALFCWRMDNNGNPRAGGGYPYPSKAQVRAYLSEHPGLRNSLTFGDQAQKSGVRYPPSLATGLHYLMAQREPELADWFWETLSSGTGLLDGHPILTLRNYLIRELTSNRGGRITSIHRAAITIKAWNAMRAGRSLRVIKWVRSGDMAEEFPAIA